MYSETSGDEFLNRSGSSSETLDTHPQWIRSDDSDDDSDDSETFQSSRKAGAGGSTVQTYRRRTLRRQKDDIRRFPSERNPFLSTSQDSPPRMHSQEFRGLEGLLHAQSAQSDATIKRVTDFRLAAYCRCERYDLDGIYENIQALGRRIRQISSSNVSDAKRSGRSLSRYDAYEQNSHPGSTAMITTCPHSLPASAMSSRSLDASTLSSRSQQETPTTSTTTLGRLVNAIYSSDQASVQPQTSPSRVDETTPLRSDPNYLSHSHLDTFDDTYRSLSHESSASTKKIDATPKPKAAPGSLVTTGLEKSVNLLAERITEIPSLSPHELAHVLGTIASFGGEAIMLVPLFGTSSTNMSAGPQDFRGTGPPRVAFVFDYGCVCFFNYDKHEEEILLNMLSPFEVATRPRPKIYFRKDPTMKSSTTTAAAQPRASKYATLSQGVFDLRPDHPLRLASNYASGFHPGGVRETQVRPSNTGSNHESKLQFPHHSHPRGNHNHNRTHHTQSGHDHDHDHDHGSDSASDRGVVATAISAFLAGVNAAWDGAMGLLCRSQRVNLKEGGSHIPLASEPTQQPLTWCEWVNDLRLQASPQTDIRTPLDSKDKRLVGFTPRELAAGCEELRYCYAPLGEGFSVKNDTVCLSSKDPHEKLAVAFALAQAVKLNVFEARIEQVIQRNERLSYSLARTGKPGISKLEISKRIGEIFLERSDVNLHSDILGSPEFFWDEGVDYHDVYDACVNFLEIPKRVDLLNMRLDVLQELFDILNNLLDSSHMGKLNEVIILLLVMSTVLILGYDLALKDLGGFLTEPIITKW